MTRFFAKVWLGLIALALLAATTQTAIAQRGGGRGMGMGGPTAKARLATLSEVETELKLTDDQKSKIKAISEQLVTDTRGLFGGGGDPSETREKMEQLNKDASAKVDALLDAGQQKRLQEIAIQVNGPSALSDPAVSKQLALTDEQTKKLEEVRQGNFQAMRDAFADMGQMSREERQTKRDELKKASDEKLLGVLTDQQKTEFDALKGAPLTVDLSPLRPQRGGGGCGGGGNRANN
jgi:Spy/CpxP family protein refolding chaperone